MNWNLPSPSMSRRTKGEEAVFSYKLMNHGREKRINFPAVK